MLVNLSLVNSVNSSYQYVTIISDHVTMTYSPFMQLTIHYILW